ncbi:MAG: hypothetical protein KDI75_03510 [Xanthomonadales bacterium]|nr:hypothetical protein [Xanthomonadales bacterium]
MVFARKSRSEEAAGDAPGRHWVTHRIGRLLGMNHRARDVRVEPRNRLSVLPGLQRWQSRRLARSHADLLAAADSRAATSFFLSDLYGDHDVGLRDREMERVMPMMQRVLSPAMLMIAADAIELAVLSHALDLRVAEQLAIAGIDEAGINVDSYAAAYRATGHRRLRQRQIQRIESVGLALGDAVNQPWIARLLRLARGPARLAGLLELQRFLERGFDAFGQLDDVPAFMRRLCDHERSISARLFAAERDPFGFGEAPSV